jgi:predicted ester cyclase
MSENSKELIRRLWDVWHSRDIGQLGDMIAENHLNGDPNNASDLVDVEGYRELITMYTTLLPDLRFDIHEMIADGNVVGTRWTAVGTHTGEALGLAPTNVAV